GFFPPSPQRAQTVDWLPANAGSDLLPFEGTRFRVPARCDLPFRSSLALVVPLLRNLLPRDPLCRDSLSRAFLSHGPILLAITGPLKAWAKSFLYALAVQT